MALAKLSITLMSPIFRDPMSTNDPAENKIRVPHPTDLRSLLGLTNSAGNAFWVWNLNQGANFFSNGNNVEIAHFVAHKGLKLYIVLSSEILLLF